jgi:hypothetical protein
MIPINVPEVFKYNSVLSIPLFSLIALLLVRKAPDFSFSKHTVSKSVLFLNHPTQALLFRFNFLLKGLLDLGFVFYLLYFFKTSLNSLPAWCLILSALLFGSLAYFVEGSHTVAHRIVTYGSGVLWAYGQLYFGYLTGDTFFRQFTNIMVTIPIILAFGFMFAKKTNVIIQALCMAMWYIWLVVFVFKYL